MKIKTIQTTCNQCREKMKILPGFGNVITICVNPRCHNYALFQVGAEDMEKFNGDKHNELLQKPSNITK